MFCYLCCSGKVPYFIYLFKYTSYNFTHKEIKNNSIKPTNQLGSAKKKNHFTLRIPPAGLVCFRFYTRELQAWLIKMNKFTWEWWRDPFFKFLFCQNTVQGACYQNTFVCGNFSLLIPNLCYLRIWWDNVQIHTIPYLYFFQVCSLHLLNYLILKDLLEIQWRPPEHQLRTNL